MRISFSSSFLVRAWGFEPQRISAQEPKGDVTSVKVFCNLGFDSQSTVISLISDVLYIFIYFCICMSGSTEIHKAIETSMFVSLCWCRQTSTTPFPQWLDILGSNRGTTGDSKHFRPRSKVFKGAAIPSPPATECIDSKTLKLTCISD